MTTPENFKLTPTEAASELWLKVDRYLAQRLGKARERNDGALSPDETATVRGEIKALKGLLALGKILPPIDGT